MVESGYPTAGIAVLALERERAGLTAKNAVLGHRMRYSQAVDG